MKLTLKVYHPSLDWASIDEETIETDDYGYFVIENRGNEASWYLIGYRWVWMDDPNKKKGGSWVQKEWDIQSVQQAIQIYQKIPDKTKTINSYWYEQDGVKRFIEKLLEITSEAPSNRFEIRKLIQQSGKSLYESLSFCKSLQYLAGELMAQNEEYVLNHYGADETIGTQHILKTGFTDNQIIFLKNLKKIITTAPYNELLQIVLEKVNEMITDESRKGGGSLQTWEDLHQLKAEIESCGTRPAIVLKKKR